MPVFRFHKGSLQESLATCKIVKSHKELFDILNSHPLIQLKDWDDIKITPYMFDHRIGWNTQMVLIKENDRFSPIGFLSDSFCHCY